MNDGGFHFDRPLWLLILLIPAVVYLWLRLTSPRHDTDRYRNYADAHLLPFLLGIREVVSAQQRRHFLRWAALWSLLACAMAGPRWDYTDIHLFRPGNDLLILLDISQSMNTSDVSPNRLTRARQEIVDIIRENRNARIGLVAFATLAHVVAPLTEDTQSLHALLPALTSDLTELKGSRLTEALIRAKNLFSGQPHASGKHVLVITDGDFGDQAHEDLLQQLTRQDIKVHVMGIGTKQGGAVLTSEGRALRERSGGEILTRLDEASLKKIAEKGNGIYVNADFNDADTHAILAIVKRHSPAAKEAEEKTRVWNDRFYGLVALVMIVLLPGYRWVSMPSGKREGGGQ